MQKLTIAAFTLTAGLALGVMPALAADIKNDATTRTEAMTKSGSLDKAAQTFGIPQGSSSAQLSALGDKLVGKSVTNGTGEEIGEIEDIAVGPDQDAYAIVSVGEFLGLGGKEVPISVSELGLAGEDVVLMSETSAETLEAMPEYDPSLYRSYDEGALDTELETEY